MSDRSVKGDADHVVEKSTVGCSRKKHSVVSITVTGRSIQFKEFELHFIIFKYFLWGLPLPISSSLSPSFAHTTSCPLWEATNHRRLMDTELGRCRRTDGKRWRCHQSVVPNEKYCIKHINRGRKRSRKLVEETLGNNTGSIPGLEVPAIHNRGSHPRNEMSRVAIKASTTEKVETSSEEKHEIVVKERIAAINLALGLDISPSENASQDGRRCAEAEHSVRPPRDILPRCKRTDGRRWHCHNIALPGIKYCAKHRNRAKVFSPSAQEQQKRGLGLGMDLNMMLPAKLASPSLNIRGHTSSSSSSDPSTETTISDESAYMSNVVAVVSPSIQ